MLQSLAPGAERNAIRKYIAARSTHGFGRFGGPVEWATAEVKGALPNDVYVLTRGLDDVTWNEMFTQGLLVNTPDDWNAFSYRFSSEAGSSIEITVADDTGQLDLTDAPVTGALGSVYDETAAQARAWRVFAIFGSPLFWVPLSGDSDGYSTMKPPAAAQLPANNFLQLTKNTVGWLALDVIPVDDAGTSWVMYQVSDANLASLGLGNPDTFYQRLAFKFTGRCCGGDLIGAWK